MFTLNELIEQNEVLKNRFDLEPHFKTGQVPEQADFFALIHNMISKKEDGIFKDGDNPLCIKVANDKEKNILLFYEDGDTQPAWSFRLENTNLLINSRENTNSLIIESSVLLKKGLIVAINDDSGRAKFGVFGEASGKNGQATGVYGRASGEKGQNFGVMGEASGENGLNIGVYGRASGSIDNGWAGFFDGNAYVYNRLQIGGPGLYGDDNINAKLDVNGHAYSFFGWIANFQGYAELFESLDGKEIPWGTAVVIVPDGKIRPAIKGEVPIGVITSSYGFLGGGSGEWNEKYAKDKFGNLIFEEAEESVEEISFQEENGNPTPQKEINTKKVYRPKIDPLYDNSIPYVPKAERPEWNIVGLLGKFFLIKDQPVDPSWVKMADVIDGVEFWFIK